ncbi:hypothetical protein ACHAPJ_009637 [Fusarium lateritium]
MPVGGKQVASMASEKEGTVFKAGSCHQSQHWQLANQYDCDAFIGIPFMEALDSRSKNRPAGIQS